ncbi:MAG: ElyC/SanA/YdcF family protein [Candidatus Peregrinibacteria bacterium]|nr:ElyC/SanA/YdcF family protein [Candidatus Peregrinibacteria bacterium]
MKTQKLKQYTKKFLKTLVVASILGIFTLSLFAAYVVSEGKSLIYVSDEYMSSYPVGIVFGAGIKNDGTPSDILKDRLITAATLYQAGVLDKILVSGDNSQENYDEPQAMFDYLVQTWGIPEEDIVRDYAGRRTYDTCARAHEIWGIEEALLITQGYHLPRALFICNAMGIDSLGFSATRQTYAGEKWYKTREIIAIHVAILDVYILKPDYIGGQPEIDFQ